MTPTEIIAAYEALVAKAIKIADGAPHWCGVNSKRRHGPIYLAINGIDGRADLAWRDASYNGDTFEENLMFDASLLDLGDAEIEALQSEQEKREAERREREEAALRLRHEAEERAQYERLKARFEPENKA